MPNWCITNYEIKRDAEIGGVKPLFDLINKWQGEGTEFENSWGNNWLGLLVEKGFETNPCKSRYMCRGSFYDMKISADGTFLTLTAETAFAPSNGIWFDLVEKYLPGATLRYTAEDPGNDFFGTNQLTLGGNRV